MPGAMMREGVYGPKCCGRNQGIRGYGNPNDGVVFIGIAPGIDEIKAGKPFVGVSGQLLDSVLRKVSWPRERVYCTNACCWRNNNPSPADLAVCQPRLHREIANLHPKLIVTFGEVPASLFTRRRLSEVRGFGIWNDTFQCWVMPTYHPAAVLRGHHDLIYDIIRDLAKIPDMSGWPKDYGHVAYKVVHTAREQWQANNWLWLRDAGSLVTIDIETGTATEDDAHSSQLVCLAISDGVDTYVLPYEMARTMTWPNFVRYGFHNGQFDVQGLKRHLGAELRVHEDSMLQSYTLDERTANDNKSVQGLHSLERLAAEYCGGQFYKEATQYELARGRAAALDPTLLYERNARDAAYTYRLINKFTPRQEAEGVAWHYRNVLTPAANMYAAASYAGVPVDAAFAAQLTTQWRELYTQHEAHIAGLAREAGWVEPTKRHRILLKDRVPTPELPKGEPWWYESVPFNPRSWQQLSRLLYTPQPQGGLGLKGGPSTDKEHLNALRGKHPIVDFMLDEYRPLGHMLTHYLEPLQEYIRDDGHLHPSVLLHGTNTGRPSYRKPPLQTVPHYVRASLAIIRRMFAAESDDYLIIEADYSQIEVWMAAAYSNDQNMFRDLYSGDYHSAVTSRVFGLHKPTEDDDKTYHDTWDLRRQASKVITFGNMYGTQAPSLAPRLGSTVARAQEYLNEFFGEYAAFRAQIKEWERQAKQQGYIEYVTGIKRRFPLVLDNKALRQAVNSPIQGTAGFYAITAAVELHEGCTDDFDLNYPYQDMKLADLDSRVLFTVHDSIVMHVAKRYFAEVCRLVRHVMEKPRFEGFPSVPVEIKAGPNWYDTRVVHKGEEDTWLQSLAKDVISVPG